MVGLQVRMCGCNVGRAGEGVEHVLNARHRAAEHYTVIIDASRNAKIDLSQESADVTNVEIVLTIDRDDSAVGANAHYVILITIDRAVTDDCSAVLVYRVIRKDEKLPRNRGVRA